MTIIDYIIFIFSIVFAPIKTYEAYHEQIGKATNALIITIISILTTASLMVGYLLISVVKAYSYHEKRTIWRWENIEGFEILKSIFEVSLSIMFVVLVVSICYTDHSYEDGREAYPDDSSPLDSLHQNMEHINNKKGQNVFN